MRPATGWLPDLYAFYRSGLTSCYLQKEYQKGSSFHVRSRSFNNTLDYYETIHPFIDGNGRVGRLLLPLMLFAEGYPPVYLAGFLKENQQEYYDTLAAVQLRGEWMPWVRFLAEGVQMAARETLQTAERLTALLDQWKTLIRTSNVRSDALPHRLPEYLIAHPVVTVRSIQEAFNTSFPTANAALNIMQKNGIVVPHSERKRDRIFIATEVINVLNRPPVPDRVPVL